MKIKLTDMDFVKVVRMSTGFDNSDSDILREETLKSILDVNTVPASIEVSGDQLQVLKVDIEEYLEYTESSKEMLAGVNILEQIYTSE